MSEQDYLNIVTAPQVEKTQVTDQLKANVPKTVEEIHAAHILVATKAEADEIETELKGGYDFATLAAEKSTDTGTKASGGDLGWFASTANGGGMVQQFSDGAFKLTTPGQISDPVQSTYGWHIIKLIERGQRELDSDSYQRAVDAAYTKWFDAAKAAAIIIPPAATPTPTAGLPTDVPTDLPTVATTPDLTTPAASGTETVGPVVTTSAETPTVANPATIVPTAAVTPTQ